MQNRLERGGNRLDPIISVLQKYPGTLVPLAVDTAYTTQHSFRSETESIPSTPQKLRSAPGSTSSLLGHLDAAFGNSPVARDQASLVPTLSCVSGSEDLNLGGGCDATLVGVVGKDTCSAWAGRVARRDKVGLFYSLPNEVLVSVLDYVASRRLGNIRYESIQSCALVDRRWNMCASSFLWRHVFLRSQSCFESFMRTLADTKWTMHRYGRFVRSISLLSVDVHDSQWQLLIQCCTNLESIFMERVSTLTFEVEMQALQAQGKYDRSSNLGQLPCDNAVGVIDYTSAPLKLQTVELDGCILLQRFYELVVVDSPQLLLGSIVKLLQHSPKTKRLAISGCNFNDDDMCKLVQYCPYLRDISIGSHMSNGQVLSQSIGGDAFADALVTTCPDLYAVDLTGIVSMTDDGFSQFLHHHGAKLQKLQLRLAMQISVDALFLISKYCGYGCLRRLTLANIPHMTDDLLERILQNGVSETLESLQLEALRISDVAIAVVGRQCIGLKHLRLCGLAQLSNLAVILGDGCHSFPKLRQLILHDVSHLTEETPLRCIHQDIAHPMDDSWLDEQPRIMERTIYDLSDMDPSSALTASDLQTPQSALLRLGLAQTVPLAYMQSPLSREASPISLEKSQKPNSQCSSVSPLIRAPGTFPPRTFPARDMCSSRKQTTSNVQGHPCTTPSSTLLHTSLTSLSESSKYIPHSLCEMAPQPPPTLASQQCSIGAPYLDRLEVIGCTGMTEETLTKLLRHWVHVRRFVFVGTGVTADFRQRVLKVLPKCKPSIYVLSTTTPNF
ncbi:hypothetical protein BASA50_005121 [Batrachochytrium salamandrivorans]|uniref:F-box domain-containing protein n=1 Tax=Batrachochytrium salamandrivorans TaxID=1357716 RepID=A0ABQ8FDH8_9FUNG|nr:hypothetical protein BASA50_005121 [Batrachochytrium salamandrivorans]